MGALESNAGDDFHFWWAATRALALIEPGTQSTVLTLERLGCVDDPEDEYEAVDVAEYIGGHSLDTASTVVISQLKHSTRNPDKAWTVSRLCELKIRRAISGSILSRRSVIADLAGVYAQLLAAGRSRDELLDAVRISLVSNQPGDPPLQAAVAAAADWARSHPVHAGKAALFRALSEPHVDIVRRLAHAVGSHLGSRQFCDFMVVLDLSQLGTLSRAALARGVRAGAAGLTPGRGPDSARRLYDLVYREALPESRGAGIRAADVLAELGVADTRDLYPAPARFPELGQPLPTPGARVIADAVLDHPGSFVLAQGPAGTEKTTALRQLCNHLPRGSVVELFDCYGNGEYRNSGEERHTPQRFVTQTINELAQRCGTPLLVHPPTTEEDLWLRLRRTLEHAVETLDAGAVLVLAIDAADNAAFAASESGDRGFLPGLVRLPFPPRVTVVLTTRTHQAGAVGAPSAARVELMPFDAATSAAHLRRYRPDASDDDAREFHARTGGYARAQYYILTQAATDGRNMSSLLEVCARTPDALFELILDSALQVSGADAGGQRWLALMIALARPIRTEMLAAALGVDPSAVDAFADGLAPGVVVADGAIQFRDDDFESYIRGKITAPDVAEAHNRLADMFIAIHTQDADAAAYVADHLFAAGRLDEVLELVLDEDWPRAIPDGFRCAQTQGRRLDLAARAAAQTGSAADAVRVAVRGCDTAGRLDTLSTLVESNLDLVARHTDLDLLRLHALRRPSDSEWLAPVHMRLAAVLARDPARRAAARAELDHATAWLRRWMTSPKEETYGWNVDADDVACAAEARYRLDGAGAAVAELRKWRPTKFVLDAAAALAARVAPEMGPAAVHDVLREYQVPVIAQAPFLAYAVGPTAAPDRVWVDEVVTAMLAASTPAMKPGEDQLWHLGLVSVAARHGDRGAAAALARQVARPLPSHRWAYGRGDAYGVVSIRALAIAAALEGTSLNVEDLVPVSLRPPQVQDQAGRPDSRGGVADQHAHERHEWIAVVSPVVAAAMLAARAAIVGVSPDEVATFVVEELAGRTEKAGHRWFTGDNSYRAWATMAAEAAIDSHTSWEVIGRLVDAAPVLLRDGAPDLWLDLAAGFTQRGVHAGEASDLCRRAAAYRHVGAHPASDRLELLTRAAGVAEPVAPALGKLLFDQAVDAATGINDDAARLIAVHADLATRAVIAESDQSGLAAQLIRVAEVVAPHVTDAGVIPYGAIAGAAAQLDAGIALAAVSRWDDEDRIRLARTLPAALLGAIDGCGVTAAQALLCDHLVEDDAARLRYQLAVVDRLRTGTAGTTAARLALRRSAEWLRRDVPARAQPELASHLLTWAAEHGLDGPLQASLQGVASLHREEPSSNEWWAGRERDSDAHALLTHPADRGWAVLADDVMALVNAGAYGDRMRIFITAVAGATPPDHRVDALAMIADLPREAGADVVVPVLADLLTTWNGWPGLSAWAANALPGLLIRYLPDLAWRDDTDRLINQLRAFASAGDVRHAVLAAIPDARSRLTPYGWQNIAVLLGRLCGAADAADALAVLLADRLVEAGVPPDRAPNDPAGPLPSLLWSASGHPRRAIRWRAAHTARDLLIRADPSTATEFAAALVGCLDRVDPGPYRDPNLYFYRMSAITTLLSALARVAADKPAILAPHLPALMRHATSRDLPHAQIRELARWTALAVAGQQQSLVDELRQTNQPATCATDRIVPYHNDRHVSPDRRYRFDTMDTIPYWYAPLAHVFGLPVDTIAEHAERWILDQWGFDRDDWMTDTRELRDQRSWERTSHRQGVIPPEENLHLYLEYHAMMAAAGDLVDEGRPVHVDSWDDADDPWRHWLDQHLPLSAATWLADLGTAVPIEPELFGHLPPLDEWDTPTPGEHDRVLELAGGCLPNQVLVAGHTTVHRPGAYSHTYVHSALVAPTHADDLQRALAAANDPTDWKLPDEDDDQFEVNYGPFVLHGWLTDPHVHIETLDEQHDPYAHDIRPVLPMPGRLFRDTTRTSSDSTGLILRSPASAVLAHAEQWADPRPDNTDTVYSSGSRLLVDRSSLLQHLADSDTVLIVEVQIGRHRSGPGRGEYQPPSSRLYLIDAAGRVTSR